VYLCLFVAELKSLLGDLSGVHLVMAGGYDDRVVENVEHYEELRRLVIEKIA
jgi:alpha-1,3/alpha-1,6-mannosyltransferase